MRSLICAMTHCYVPWLVSMCHDSFLCAVTHFYVPWLYEWVICSWEKWQTHSYVDPFICAMTHLYVPWLKSLLYWKHTSAVYFTQKSILLRKCPGSLLYSEVYFTENINQQSTLLKTYLSSLLYWIHTSAVDFTQKSTVLRKKLRSLLYSEVYCTENTPQQSTLLNTYFSSLLRSLLSEKYYFGHFPEVSEIAFLKRKSKNLDFSEVETHFFWEMLSQRLLRKTPEMAFLRSLLYESLYVVQHAATHCNTKQHTATHCNTLQHAATRCNTLQHAATRCNTLKLQNWIWS